MSTRIVASIAIAMFIAGVWLLTTLPVVAPERHLIAGWGLVVAGLVTFLSAVPADDTD